MKAKAMTKAMLLAICAVLFVTVSVFTTIAFLKSNDQVVNTFKVGKVSITLDETKVDEYGNMVAGASRVKANTYKLIPGHSYAKDPTVHFAADSEKSYLFVKVENGLSAIEANTEKIADQIIENGWTALDGVNSVYFMKVGANDTGSDKDYAVFGSFTLADSANVELFKDKNITVTAYAIQADGFDTPAAAWAAGNFN